ncbi:MAG TPA: flagellar hook protein FlgE [Candidatus Sulfotelmatobacter sp.]|nr:flagellar hook protein FlgE [Candidatus Sulfotelmatobacter sp.]
MPNFSIPLSGLTAESTALSAIANNLSNQNTTGYKDTGVLFSDLFYQNLGTTGSGDPIQEGAGTKVSSMPSLFTQGSVSATGVPTDAAIQGSGFFVVQNANGSLDYTRAGDFTVDNSNYLVTFQGQQVLGYPAVNGVVNTGAAIAPLQLGAGTISPPTATGNVQLTLNLNSATGPTGTPYSTPIQIYDSLGAPHTLTATFTNTGPNTWDYSLSIPATDLSAPGATGVLATGTLTFNGNGVLIGDTATTGGAVAGALGDVTGIPITGLADGATNMTFNWNVLNGTSPVLTQVAAPDSTTSANQDGNSSGSLTSFTIGSDGTITGSFSNGATEALGQIVLASFANNNGLELNGNTDFTPTLASGPAVLGIPGAGELGTLSGGSLELSNVDIATEFANLIVAQRGFEADAKAVTTFDQITQDTIALKQ